ncbi:hypothetical protein PHLCEN_2v8393 [Hermanssonia centrifuga]|uniref:Uncharacterized protein n=1 Tax=Hermanssonia centrifuga TaxID=98765 RepID=A0A2R6NTN6_9APHY|nr:hypothetical protein PHLCEN_2v8393 [Hermanssonia centrifuga]
MPPLPEQGKEEGDEPPIDMAWLYREPDTVLDVNLMVVRADAGSHRLNHWELFWMVRDTPDSEGIRVARRISLEVAKDKNHRRLNHLTYWGAVTKQMGPGSRVYFANIFHVGKLTAGKRDQLETIASNTPVMNPNHNNTLWNCQDFTRAVLSTALQYGILEHRTVQSALDGASQIHPLIPG